ncbi:MAG: acyl-ACP thioesterase domain-containing protein, partial [Bacteroidota bacterium]
PSGFDRSLVYRDYRFCTPEGEVWGRASSTWLVLDLNRRRPSRVPETWLSRIRPPQEMVSMDRFTDKWDALKKGSRSVSLKVRWPHLDINQHVNQTHYVSWCLDTLSHALHQEAQCRQIDLILRKEILLGEEILIHSEPQKADMFNHVILGERGGKVKAQMLSYWEPRKG